GNVEVLAHAHRRFEVVERGADTVRLVVVPVVHEHGRDVVALPLEQQRRDGRVDAAGEAEDDVHVRTRRRLAGAQAPAVSAAGTRPSSARTTWVTVSSEVSRVACARWYRRRRAPRPRATCAIAPRSSRGPAVRASRSPLP